MNLSDYGLMIEIYDRERKILCNKFEVNNNLPLFIINIVSEVDIFVFYHGELIIDAIYYNDNLLSIKTSAGVRVGKFVPVEELTSKKLCEYFIESFYIDMSEVSNPHLFGDGIEKIKRLCGIATS